MSNNEIKYLLGIDGGGTKTEFLLCGVDGKEIRRLFLDGSNPINKGIENTYIILESGENQKLIAEFLSRFGFARSDCGSDIDLVLETALKGSDGTAVIMGTGIVAYSRSGARLHRSGGRGYLIDKGGSGFHFGSDALNAAFEAVDDRGGSETILKLTEDKLGKNLETSVTEIYSGGAAYIASFAPVVFEAFNLGDSVAKEIIDRNAYEAAKVINGARKALNNCTGKIIVCGGLCKQRDILYPFMMKYIEGTASLEFLHEPIVNGAVSLAKGRIEIC